MTSPGMRCWDWSNAASIAKASRPTGTPNRRLWGCGSALSLAKPCFAPERFTMDRSIVIYTRFSTDMQRADSCEDQERNVRVSLARMGIDATQALVIKDE